MIRSPLGLRIEPSSQTTMRDQIRQAARLGAKGIVLDATGDLAPDRISETGRRDLRHTLRSSELTLIGLNLPTRRPFDTEEDLDIRLARADRAFALAYELGARLVLARAGAVPAVEEAARRTTFLHALTELGRRADHRGVRLTVESGTEEGRELAEILTAIGSTGLAASIDPAASLKMGFDPIATTRDLGFWVLHAYASDAASSDRFTAGRRHYGMSAGVLDWSEYLGALEEIEYRGFLTAWPDPSRDVAVQFLTLVQKLQRF